ncbi:mitogen-activated protein kinase kinase kinase 17 isoform X2 [Jatropha curcas]|uniref:mitogen-activated protein kinase kinase kinase 17 isoform X2 n=1 Tax=Jatropha curcas TaxID=180498 RepID=UPI0009D6E04C|nr:mitogen-activated protein kinase kinase kinase 17 isoform X2 [Jatropha curcas]
MKRKAVYDCEEGGVLWQRGPLLGRGGFGCVYLAELKKSKSRTSLYPQLMAVKCAEFSVSNSLQKEKQVFDDLCDSPYVLKCYGEETTTASSGEMIYNLLLEYASGGTLSSLIKGSDGGRLAEPIVKRYTKCILKGIDYIHRNSYVHCDLKPDNVLLVSSESSDFVPKIGDFGLSRKCQRNKRRKFDYGIGGTAPYMAPETLTDNIQEASSDIWALGCIVLEMFTGKKVWDSKGNMGTDEIIQKIADRYELPEIPNEISKAEFDETIRSQSGEVLDERGSSLSNNPDNEVCTLTSYEESSTFTSEEGSSTSSSSLSSDDEEECDSQEFCSAPVSTVIDEDVHLHKVKQ